MTSLLQVSRLRTTFYLDGVPSHAVDGVSFDVREGETVAIVGESGSGKSITAMSILRLIPSPPGEITGGEIRFDGRDLLDLSDAEMLAVRGNAIAMIFQEPMSSLNPVLTVGEQLAEPIKIHGKIHSRAAIRAACLGLLNKVRIPDPARALSSYPHELSGGMRQRVMIAMGLACAPRLIIADEPTTALDVTVQAQILDLLKDLSLRERSAVLLITHDLGVVAQYAERINVMYAGRIVEQGRAADIFYRPSHPYTRGLLNSIPRLDRPVEQRLKPIAGQPPDIVSRPAGCAFNTRCGYAVPRCRTEAPPLETVSDSHRKACWINLDAA